MDTEFHSVEPTYFYLISNEKVGLHALVTMVTFYSRWFNEKDSLHNAKYFHKRQFKVYVEQRAKLSTIVDLHDTGHTDFIYVVCK